MRRHSHPPPEGDSQVTWFEGSFEEYERWVRETRGEEAPSRTASRTSHSSGPGRVTQG